MGPPGTGKTDVAVQIISNIYHNFPEQRTLIVTHSNQVITLYTNRSERCTPIKLLVTTFDNSNCYWNCHFIHIKQFKALNQLFEKIMALDIDERHLLRLGHGEEALETEKDFSRSAVYFL